MRDHIDPASRTIALIGPPAAGKTRLGKRLARRLSLPFVDTDAVVVSQHGPIPEIFARHGEPYFRELERAAVAEAIREPGVARIGLGSGVVADSSAGEEWTECLTRARSSPPDSGVLT